MGAVVVESDQSFHHYHVRFEGLVPETKKKRLEMFIKDVDNKEQLMNKKGARNIYLLKFYALWVKKQWN